MTPLPAARGRLGLLAAFYVVELVVAWLLAAPFVELAVRVLGNHPGGDRALLWAPGQPIVFDLAMQHGVALRAMAGATIAGLVVFWAFGVLLEGALFAGLAERGPLRAARLGERSFALAGRMIGRAGVSLVFGFVLLLLVGVAPISAMAGRLEGATPRAQILLVTGPVLLTLLAFATFRAFLDLVAALCARRDDTLGAALVTVLRSPRAVLAQTSLALPRWIAALGTLGFGAAFSTSSKSVLAIFVVHQAAAFARVVLRGSVVARALRVVDDVIDADGRSPRAAPRAAEEGSV